MTKPFEKSTSQPFVSKNMLHFEDTIKMAVESFDQYVVVQSSPLHNLPASDFLTHSRQRRMKGSLRKSPKLAFKD